MAPGLLLRSRACSRAIYSALKPHKKAIVAEISSPMSRISSPKRRISCIARLPVESSCLVSMMPLHSAVALARLISALAPESQSYGRVPMGLSMPL